MKKDFAYVKDHLVLTYHSYENKNKKRKDISINAVANAIANAKFIDFAGNKRYKVTHNGITVVYKMDYSDISNPLYVIITYYKSKKNKKALLI